MKKPWPVPSKKWIKQTKVRGILPEGCEDGEEWKNILDTKSLKYRKVTRYSYDGVLYIEIKTKGDKYVKDFEEKEIAAEFLGKGYKKYQIVAR